MSSPLIDAAKQKKSPQDFNANDTVSVPITHGELQARNVIFACTPVGDYMTSDKFRECYKNIFSTFEQDIKAAKEKKTLAISSFSTGQALENVKNKNPITKENVAQAAIEEALDHLKRNPNTNIRFVCFEDSDLMLYQKILNQERQKGHVDRISVAKGNIEVQDADAIVCPIREKYDLTDSGPTAKAIIRVADENLKIQKQKEAEVAAIHALNRQQQRQLQEDLTLHSHESHLRERDAKEKIPSQISDEAARDEWVTIGNISEGLSDSELELENKEAIEVLEIIKDLGNTKFGSESIKRATENNWLKKLQDLIPSYEKLCELIPNPALRAKFLEELMTTLNKKTEDYGPFKDHIQALMRFRTLSQEEAAEYLLEWSNNLSEVTQSKEAYEIIAYLIAQDSFKLKDAFPDPIKRANFLEDLELNYNELKNKQVVFGVITNDSIPKDTQKAKNLRDEANKLSKQLLNQKKDSDLISGIVNQIEKLIPTYRSLYALFPDEAQRKKFIGSLEKFAKENNNGELSGHLRSLKKENVKLFRSIEFETYLKTQKKALSTYDFSLEELETQRLREGGHKKPTRGAPEDAEQRAHTIFTEKPSLIQRTAQTKAMNIETAKNRLKEELDAIPETKDIKGLRTILRMIREYILPTKERFAVLYPDEKERKEILDRLNAGYKKVLGKQVVNGEIREEPDPNLPDAPTFKDEVFEEHLKSLGE